MSFEERCIPFLGDILSPDSDWPIVATPNAMVRGILGPLLSSKRRRAMITHIMNMSKFTMDAGVEHGRTSVNHWALQPKQVRHVINIP